MHVLNIESQTPFTTKDGSTIRSILDRTNAPVRQQSLAEASVPAGVTTQRHYHRESEEFYFILSGGGKNGDQRRSTHRWRRRRYRHPARRVALHCRCERVALSLLLFAALLAR